jgi:anaerobic selenocysteine-containing dehydrogenase
MRQHRSFCRLCGASCGLIATIEDSRVVSVRGDDENPYSEGYLCGKGRMLGLAHHDPRRLDRAMLGRPPMRRESGLDATLDDLCERLRAIIDESGPDAVGIYMGTFGFLESGTGGMTGRGPLLRMATALGTRSFYTAVTVDTVAQLVAGVKVTRGRHTMMPMVDYPRAQLLLMFGHNPVVSHAAWTNPVVKMRRAKSRGEVWVIDPRRTETAALASHHVQLRAGTDVFLLAHLVREVLRDGLDERYVREHCTGADELRAAVEPHTATATAARTGVPLEQLAQLVHAIRGAGTIACTSGTGPRMGPLPTLTQFLVYVLSVITGSIDRRGGSLVLGRGLSWGPPGVAAEAPGPASRPELTTWFGQAPCAALADEIEARNVRALLCFAGNPAVALPEHDRMLAALQGLEVLAVHDVVSTASSELATHVLPATGEFEDSSFIRGVTPDGRMFTQYAPAAFDPVGDRRPAWWYIDRIGRQLGVSVFGDDFTEADVHAPGEDDVLEELRQSPTGMAIGDELPFGTLLEDLPEGGWDLAPADLLEQLRGAEDMPALVLIPRRQVRHVNTYLVDVTGPSGKLDAPELLMHPRDAEACGIADGALAVVTTTTGSLTLRARVTEDIAPGAVSVPHGFVDASVSRLVSATYRVDPVSGMPLQGGVPVTVRAVGAHTDGAD